MLDKQIFYDVVRKRIPGSLKSGKQVEGYEYLLKEGAARGLEPNELAYVLATVFWETGKTMQPVTEYGSDKYLRSKKYWPYIGRGLVQITWKENYAKYGIADTPEKALEWPTALHILFDGMIHGKFTGKKLSDYFSNGKKDWYNARRIINGTDKASQIGGFGQIYFEALETAGYTSSGKGKDKSESTKGKGSKPLAITIVTIILAIVGLILKNVLGG